MFNFENFGKLANYLTHPLVLTGFAILCFYTIHKLLIASGILPPVSQSASSTIVKLLLKYGYVVALVTILSGFALKFWQEYIRRPSYSGQTVLVNPRIDSLVIQEGDSPVVRQQKISQARSILIQEITSNIAAIDSRLAFVDESATQVESEAPWRQAARRTAPAAAEAMDEGYSKLMAEAAISSLRQAINGVPLRSSFSGPLAQVLLDAGIQVGPVRAFYDQLAGVESATESLLHVLAERARERERTGPNWQEYSRRRTMLAVKTLGQGSTTAHLVGLRALRVLGADPTEVNARLAQLRQLKPAFLPDEKTITKLLEANVAEGEQQIAQKQTLAETGKKLIAGEARNFADIERRLQITPTDTWNEVAGKAISLRQLGRLADAVAAFDKYGRMFSATDPAAAQYSRLASAFTQQINALGVEGGSYIFQVQENGAAKAAGIEPGDIVIDYDGKRIQGMDDIVSALGKSKEGEIKRLTYLRFDPGTGRFRRHITQVQSGPLGAGLMPI